MNNSFTKWWMVSQCQFMERKNTLIRDANILFPDIYWIQVYNFCCDFNQSINRLMSIYGENNSLKGDTNILVKVIYWIRLLMWFKQSINKLHLREDINRKKCFLSGIAQMRGRGGLPMPGFLAPFFCQVTVLKMAIFYSILQ